MASAYGQNYAPQQMRRLETPEGVELSLEMASAGARIGAFLLDMMMIWGSVIIISLMMLFAGAGSGSEAVGKFLMALWFLTTFVLRSFWFILFEMGPRGATPGKRILGLRVIARGGGRLEARSVVARNLLRDVELFLPLTFVFEQLGDNGNGWTALMGVSWSLLFLLFPLFNRDRMRAGDFLAGTWVIRVPKREAGYDLSEARPAEPDRYAFTDAQLAAYGAFEVQTLESVLRGQDDNALALVAETIRNKIGWPYEYDDRAFLTAYYNAVRAKLERGMLFGKKKLDKFDLGGR